ncbi:hypothetical protein AEAC466_12035 [Asticcacaulis sp. AC466]|uniref:Arm DNA-binding domain-containing protein n=1 Tax=Asticcacaulis sp. AC466 TaxID=1282362 RepID=UPI0003C3F87A|nr:Arm DNA-binding domain-containing protein [Asticcacaulis sp. AC466]ESQ83730.1 hypothetical protein AEAC466_12035 [Asticcacaulis sp. AC466]
MSLTGSAVGNARPQKKNSKLYDAGGLYLLFNPSGSKLWRLKYRFAGFDKILSLGQYPDVTLKDAHGKRD